MRGIYELETLRDDGTGDAIVVTSAIVTVLKESDGTLATLYDSIDGAGTLSNPLNVTASTLLFYADQSERYKITIESGIYARTLRYQQVSIDVPTVLARANHTGTQAASTISDFESSALSSAMITFAATAGEALGGHRMVVLDASEQAIYADAATVSHAGKVVGMTTGAAVLGDTVTVLRSGIITEPLWTWNVSLPVYLGISGLLTQTEPDTGFSQIVGVPISATKLILALREPIVII